MTRTRLAGLTAALVSVAALTASSLIATSTADARPAGDARASAAIQFTAVSIKDDGTLGMSSMFAPGLRTFKVTATKPGQEFFILRRRLGRAGHGRHPLPVASGGDRTAAGIQGREGRHRGAIRE